MVTLARLCWCSRGTSEDCAHRDIVRSLGWPKVIFALYSVGELILKG